MATDLEIKKLKEKHNELVAQANTLTQMDSTLEEEMQGMADMSSRLSMGRIKRSTAEGILTQMQATIETLKKQAEDYKNVTGLPNKEIENSIKEFEDMATELGVYIEETPKHAIDDGGGDPGPIISGPGGYTPPTPPQPPEPPTGIVPDEVEMNPPETQGGQGGEDGDNSQDNPQDQKDGGSGKDGDDDSDKDDKNKPQTPQDPSKQAGHGGQNTKDLSKDKLNGQSALGKNGISGGSTHQTASAGKQGMQDVFGKRTGIKNAKKRVKVKLGGRVIEGEVQLDIRTEDKSNSVDVQKKLRGKSVEIIDTMKSRIKVAEAKGELKDKDEVVGGANREMELSMSQLIDWKRIFADRYKITIKKGYRRTAMNTQRIARNNMKPGKSVKLKEEVVKDIIIAIDVSGSVSDEMLQSTLAEIWGMLVKYSKKGEQQISGELVYWADRVGDSGTFTSMDDIMKIETKQAGGGTDVRPVFEYVTRQRKTATGKVCSIDLKETPLILIITDGYFGDNYEDFAFLGKKVVWMIDGDARNFHPGFGMVAQLTRTE